MTAQKSPHSQKTLHKLHQDGTFLLVNVHDVGSAALAQAAGAEALGTTSAGHAYTVGVRDAAGALSRDASVERAAQICAAVDIPVSVDGENGWGHEPESVAETVRLLAEAGAAGVSIEDWSGDPAIGFYERALAVERIEAAVETARSLRETSAGGAFVICARADRVMHEGADALEDTIERLQAFSAAGADCLYAPGPSDEATIRRIVTEAGGPVNVMVEVNSGVTMDDARAWGVRRVSVGSSFYQATMAAFSAMVKEALTSGTMQVDPAPLDYAYIESLFG